MKNRKTVCYSLAIAALIIAVICSVCCAPMKVKQITSLEDKIFADISELDCLDDYIVEDLPDDERVVSGLNVIEKKCVDVNYNGNIFKVYAYVFSSLEEAKTFHSRISKYKQGSLGWLHKMQHQGARGLYVAGPLDSYKEFIEFLYDHFTTTVDKSHDW